MGATGDTAVSTEVVSFKVFFTKHGKPHAPVAQPRPRATLVPAPGTKIGWRAKIVSSFRQHPITAFKKAVVHELSLHYKGPPLACPLRMTLRFVMPRPQAITWKTKPMPRRWYSARTNDFDNLGKGVCDAMNGKLYVDDGKLVDVRVLRVIAAGGEQPHVEIGVWML